MRSVLALGFAFYVGLATGDAPLLETVCIQQCADDDADGHCAPTCSDCACCSHVRAMTVPLDLAPDVIAVITQLPERAGGSPAVPEPREILHVPIA